MESRLKNIFWPTIDNANDVDYLGMQGFWVCCAVAATSLVFFLSQGQALVAIAIFLLFFLGAAGVRERSRYAAIIVFLIYGLDAFFSPSIIHWLLLGLLLSNVRATWIAATWKPQSEEASPVPRFNETWTDELVDQLPPWLCPGSVFFITFSP